jgi:hypothetical protein
LRPKQGFGLRTQELLIQANPSNWSLNKQAQKYNPDTVVTMTIMDIPDTNELFTLQEIEQAQIIWNDLWLGHADPPIIDVTDRSGREFEWWDLEAYHASEPGPYRAPWQGAFVSIMKYRDLRGIYSDESKFYYTIEFLEGPHRRKGVFLDLISAVKQFANYVKEYAAKRIISVKGFRFCCDFVRNVELDIASLTIKVAVFSIDNIRTIQANSEKEANEIYAFIMDGLKDYFTYIGHLQDAREE